MTDREDSAGGRGKARAGAFERDLLSRIVTEPRGGDRRGRASDPTAVGGSSMNTHWREHLLERLERGDSLEQVDYDARRIGGLSEEERAALWTLGWGEQQRRPPAGLRPSAGGGWRSGERRGARGREVVVSALELARAETSMDVAVLGEIDDGREVVRLVAGDGGSFGLTVGASLPVQETYCQRVLEGRLGNVVRDASGEPLVRDLQLTRAAGIRAYIGVPLTALDARLYILCCLAHEQRPELSERDVAFLRGLGETIIRELHATPFE